MASHPAAAAAAFADPNEPHVRRLETQEAKLEAEIK